MLISPENSIAYKESGGYYGVTFYNEKLNNWDSYFTSETLGDYTPGMGYLFRRQSGSGAVSFGGTLTSSALNYPVTFSGNGDINGWNCVSNPYSSAIGYNANAASSENFLRLNSDLLDNNYEALYVWDDTERLYKIWNQVAGGDYLQSGQGFIIRTRTGGEVQFTPGMRYHSAAVALKSVSLGSWSELKITATLGVEVSRADVLFGEGMSLGVDVGYDAGSLSYGNISVYTQLASGNNGIGFGLQCLPVSSLEGVVLPVGLTTKTDGETTLCINRSGMPHTAKISLEDRKNGYFQEIISSELFYTAKVLKNESEYGRFYLHIGNTTKVEEFTMSKIRAWQKSDRIHLSGINGTGIVKVALYDVHGQKIAEREFNAADSTDEMPVSGLKSGIYLIRILWGSQSKTIKIPLVFER